MDRAYSILDCKEFDDSGAEYLIVKGIASTPTPDRHGDVVDSKGAVFKTPMPLLWQHRHDSPVGNVTFAEPNEKGIPFEARIPKVTEDGTVKTRVDEAIHSLKYDLVNAVSIGFSPIEYNYKDDGGIHFNKWEWLELSLVTIPANADALISTVKSLDQKHLPASGRKSATEQKPASGRERTVPQGPFNY
jgi:HK97 family phage prohead protease